MRTRYRVIEEEGLYFITSTTVEWLPVFTSKPYFEILMESPLVPELRLGTQL